MDYFFGESKAKGGSPSSRQCDALLNEGAEMINGSSLAFSPRPLALEI